MQEKMKTVLIPRGRKNEENFVLVSVNGRNFKIMKGVEVQVPEFVAQVLEQVDAMLPNQYTTAEKRRWLLQAEGFVVREVHQTHAGGEETEVPPEDIGEDTVLLVQPPYDELYRHYVEAQIHYANGEMERYNNACAAWNNALLTYRDFWCRSHMPRQGVKALRLM